MKLPEPVENLLHRFRRDHADDQGLVMRLRAEIDELKASQKSQKEESLAAAFESLFADLASPVAQLLLQLHLSHNSEHSLSASDVLSHVKKLVASLKQHGLTVNGQPNDVEPFEPNMHQPVVETFQPEKGMPVRICFPGIAYRGTILRKAAVDAPEAK